MQRNAFRTLKIRVENSIEMRIQGRGFAELNQQKLQFC